MGQARGGDGEAGREAKRNAKQEGTTEKQEQESKTEKQEQESKTEKQDRKSNTERQKNNGVPVAVLWGDLGFASG